MRNRFLFLALNSAVLHATADTGGSTTAPGSTGDVGDIVSYVKSLGSRLDDIGRSVIALSARVDDLASATAEAFKSVDGRASATVDAEHVARQLDRLDFVISNFFANEVAEYDKRRAAEAAEAAKRATDAATG